MSERKVKRALISVHDKTGLVEFASALVDDLEVELISTGGTAVLLGENGIPVTPVEKVTGFQEMMEGRVKTLHPRIHAAILADRDNQEHMRQLEEQGIEPIDMVVVNLYPFEKTTADPDCTHGQAIEMIDIGGPCLLRAAAKNHKHVWVVSDPAKYSDVLRLLRGENAEGAPYQRMARLLFAYSVFELTTRYDAAIMSWLAPAPPPSRLSVEVMHPRAQLRYGENPHQRAGLFRQKLDSYRANLVDAAGVGSDTPLSFNNYADGDSALRLCSDLSTVYRSEPAGETGDRAPAETRYVCAFIKHTNPCGCGVADDPIEAYRRAYLGDPNAAMGGVLAMNFQVDIRIAESVMDSLACWGRDAGAGAFFVEVWLAEGFDKDAIEIIKTRKKWGTRVRLLSVGDTREVDPANDNGDDIFSCLRENKANLDFRHITAGFLLQNRDRLLLNEEQWKVVTRRAPTDSEMADLRLAWIVCKHTKSNAITVCRDGALIGNGAGQMSRIMSCRIATWMAKENGHAGKLAGAAAASDAFFPFADGPNILVDAGVTAIIQPGGSKRDEDTIAACNERDVAMIHTGTRHFRH